jgi:hypothetical protein
MRVIELRNYRLADGRTGEFIRYFEEHFLVSQRDEGMHVLGQFAVVDHPDRFVWIRGFTDRATRLRGLTAFYDGAFWLARRETANAMIREHHDVHLLRPLGSIETLTGSASLDDRAPREPAGLTPPSTGLVVVDFYRATGARDRLVEVFETHVRPALVDHGYQVAGHFVADLTTNDYPRLPVTQDPALLVVLTACRDQAHHARLTAGWRLPDQARALLTADVTTLLLRPTARSLVRFQG